MSLKRLAPVGGRVFDIVFSLSASRRRVRAGFIAGSVALFLAFVLTQLVRQDSHSRELVEVLRHTDGGAKPGSNVSPPQPLVLQPLPANWTFSDFCDDEVFRRTADNCEAMRAKGELDRFPPVHQEAVRCWGGTMLKALDEKAVEAEWAERAKRIRAAAGDSAVGKEPDDGLPIDDVSATLAAVQPFRDAFHTATLSDAGRPPKSGAVPSPQLDERYLLNVLHGGISPAVIMEQAKQLRTLFRLDEAFGAVDFAVDRWVAELRAAIQKSAGSGDQRPMTDFKRQVLASLKRDGRLSFAADFAARMEAVFSADVPAGSREWEHRREQLTHLAAGVTVHPDTVHVELGAGAGTVSFALCPPDPFDLSTICLASDIVRVLLKMGVHNAPHMAFSEGYGFPRLAPGTATHVLSHGVGSVICFECMCGHIAEALRLLREGGTLVVWMLRTSHHNNNYDPAYFNASYLGPGVGIALGPQGDGANHKRASGRAVPNPTQGFTTDDAFFFMDKCRYDVGLHLSPFVDPDGLEIMDRYPMPLYSACWTAESFFGVRLRRSAAKWEDHYHASATNAGAKAPVTPKEFATLQTEAERETALSSAVATVNGRQVNYLAEMVSTATDLCPIARRSERAALAKRVVQSRQVTIRAKSKRKPSRPSIPLSALSSTLQTWVLDLILADYQAQAQSARYEPLPPAWLGDRLSRDMVGTRTRRITNATLIAHKCKRGKLRYWCNEPGRSTAVRIAKCK